MNSELDCRRLRALQLSIALEIRRICRNRNLRCFLVYGSLLGAVRHGGFIPWDNDMDVGMLRQDYDAFAEACQTDLRPEFLWQSWDTDPAYPFPFGKVRLKNTHIVETFAPPNVENGIYVDVFPFDAVPDGAWARRVQGWWYYAGKRLLWLKKGYGRCLLDDSPRQRLRYTVMSLLAALLPYGWLKRGMERAMTRFNHLRTRFVAAPGDWAYVKQFTERVWCDDLVPIRFEGEEFPAFRAADAYLRHLYGDYMQLPPPEQRNAHDFESIDFGPFAPFPDSP